MRCYFHLVSRHDMILDNIGVEVANLESAEAEARQAIRDLRQEDNQTDEEWQGWQLNVTDAAGQLLVSIPLDTSLQ